MIISGTRRSFIAALFALPTLSRIARTRRLDLRVAIVHERKYSAALLGARLAAAEAARAAQLLGATFDAREYELAALPVDAAESLLVLLCAPAAVDRLAHRLAPPGVFAINALASADRLDACSRGICHVAATTRQQDTALAGLARPEVAADASYAAPAGGPVHRCELWHASLDRFGAQQLNARFRQAYLVPMTGSAWAAWFAVKVIWEAAARARSTVPADIARYVTGGNTFDGHKGVPLRFEAGKPVLQQPLYITETIASASKVLREWTAGAPLELTCQ